MPGRATFSGTVDSGGRPAYLTNGDACGDPPVTDFLATGLSRPFPVEIDPSRLRGRTRR